MKLGKLPLKHQPGDAYTYGVNQDVLGALIERVSGQRFGAFLEERMFGPLGMKDTGFDVHLEKMNRLAKTYKLVEDQPIIETWPESGRGIEAGGAGIFPRRVISRASRRCFAMAARSMGNAFSAARRLN